MKLRFTLRAAAELEAILDAIASQSPGGSRRVQTRVEACIDLIRLFPEGGQRTGYTRLRKMIVVPYPYLVFFEIRSDEVVVIGVRHGA